MLVWNKVHLRRRIMT